MRMTTKYMKKGRALEEHISFRVHGGVQETGWWTTLRRNLTGEGSIHGSCVGVRGAAHFLKTTAESVTENPEVESTFHHLSWYLLSSAYSDVWFCYQVINPHFVCNTRARYLFQSLKSLVPVQWKGVSRAHRTKSNLTIATLFSLEFEDA